jgi:hypothetical protein
MGKQDRGSKKTQLQKIRGNQLWHNLGKVAGWIEGRTWESWLYIGSFRVTTKERIEQSRGLLDLVIVLGFAKQSGNRHPKDAVIPNYF